MIDVVEFRSPKSTQNSDGIADGDEAVNYQPHPDYPMVRLEHKGLDTAQGRLISFMGLGLPREAIMQIVAAYLGAIEKDKDERNDES